MLELINKIENAEYIAILVMAISIAFAIGWYLSYVRAQKQIVQLSNDNTHLKYSLEIEQQIAERTQKENKNNREEMINIFGSLSNDALKNNNDFFLKLAQEKLKQFQIHAEKDMDTREKSVKNMIDPIKEALQKTEHQIREIEKDRKESYGSLTRHLETLTETQQLLQSETRNLVQALRRPEVRGQWGEITLKRLAELSGMVEHCDFFEQEHTETEQGAIRPDMIVRLPAGREIVVDVKTPLDAYLSAIEAKDDETRNQHLDLHLRNVRNRVRELASKSYWSQFKQSPDFVVLFIPGDQFLSAALERDHSLLEDALKQHVILATPTSLVALLRAVAYGWRQETLSENADKIRQLGEDLYKRLATFGEHLAKLGKNLGSSVDTFNKTVGSLERQVIPGAKKLHDLGIQSHKQLDSPDPIDKSVRAVEDNTSDS